MNGRDYEVSEGRGFANPNPQKNMRGGVYEGEPRVIQDYQFLRSYGF